MAANRQSLSERTSKQTTELTVRKGARKVNEIPTEVLAQLNKGEIETVNLVEWLAIDLPGLAQHVLSQVGLAEAIAAMTRDVEALKKSTTPQVMLAISNAISRELQERRDAAAIAKLISTHSSDSVRCWGAYLIGLNPKLSLEQKIEQIELFAADSHFGVREIAWMSVRPAIATDLEKAIELLEAWVSDPDENIRRFATEATRPRGVWCKHIEQLKSNPELALALLEPLKSDPSKYVQDSVGNWLNDASKSQPDWVKKLCQRWLEQCDRKATHRIAAKAQRTIANIKKNAN
jgi:3-methyladenine DNA glycosylase AlkC